MEKSYTDITKRISGDLRKLRQDIPDTMKAFSTLAQAATRDGALDKKTKELIALAIGDFHPLRRLHRLPLRGPGQAWRHASGSGGDARHGRLYGRRSIADVCG